MKCAIQNFGIILDRPEEIEVSIKGKIRRIYCLSMKIA
jgi:hypothetical protein